MTILSYYLTITNKHLDTEYGSFPVLCARLTPWSCSILYKYWIAHGGKPPKTHFTVKELLCSMRWQVIGTAANSSHKVFQCPGVLPTNPLVNDSLVIALPIAARKCCGRGYCWVVFCLFVCTFFLSRLIYFQITFLVL